MVSVGYALQTTEMNKKHLHISAMLGEDEYFGLIEAPCYFQHVRCCYQSHAETSRPWIPIKLLGQVSLTSRYHSQWDSVLNPDGYAARYTTRVINCKYRKYLLDEMHCIFITYNTVGLLGSVAPFLPPHQEVPDSIPDSAVGFFSRANYSTVCMN